MRSERRGELIVETAPNRASDPFANRNEAELLAGLALLAVRGMKRGERVSRVLIVDQEGALAPALGNALERYGFEVAEALNFESACDLLGAQTFDSILLDMGGDLSRGWDELRVLRREHPDTDVVVRARSGGVEDAVRAIRLGAQDFVADGRGVDDLARLLVELSPAAGPPLSPRRTGNPAFSAIIGESLAIRELLELVAKVAATDSTVLVTGETGTGKELIGRAVHEISRRSDRTFCPINSAAFPETLLESELFGHRRGAFTGATANKRGLFEMAHRGTVFLDEVGEMPLSMQAKLLRFLQTGEIRPVGGESSQHVDVRLVTATNRDLEDAVVAGLFREDLYYRLAVIPVHVPPLRDRPEDIPLLAHHFLRRFAERMSKRVGGIERSALEVMERYAWPGNVRELENTLERGIALCKGPTLGAEDLPPRVREPRSESIPEELQSLDRLERAHILRTLDRVGWNRKRAAEILQVSTTTLWRRLKEFGVEGPQSRLI